MSDSADFFYSLYVFLYRLLYLVFLSMYLGFGSEVQAIICPDYRLQLLWEDIKVFQSYTGATKSCLLSPPGSKCS